MPPSLRPAGGGVGGVPLAISGTEHQVFRAFIVSIVLTVAVAPNLALLCDVRCQQPQVATAGACHHDEEPSAASSVVQRDTGMDCDTVVPGVAPLRPEDLRRSASAPLGGDAISVLRYLFALSTVDARTGREPAGQWSLDNRPLPTILRM
jgi:hypothetical protein